MSLSNRLLSHWPLLVVLFLFTLAKIAVLVFPHTPIWDEAVYVGMGKYMMSQGHVGLWEQFRPPLLPVIFGIIWKLGLNPLFWGETFIILCSIGLIITTYVLGLQHSKQTGTLAAILLSITPVFFLYSNYLLTHIPSIFLVTLAMIVPAYWAKGALTTLAALFRFPEGLSLFFHKWKWQLFVAAGIVSIPFFFLNYTLYHPYTHSAFDAATRPLQLGIEHQDNPFEFVKEGVWFHIAQFAREFPLLLVFSLLGLFLAWRLPVSRFFLAFVIYYHLIPNRQARFAIEFLPFMSVLAAIGIVWYMKKIKYNHHVILLLLLTLVPVILLDVSYMNWRSSERPITEMYEYFNVHPPDAAVLTANPVPSAFVDALFIPYYFYPDTTPAILNEWEREKKVSHVLWAENGFPCMTKECESTRNALYAHISKGRKVFEGTYPGKEGPKTYQIFEYAG